MNTQPKTMFVNQNKDKSVHTAKDNVCKQHKIYIQCQSAN